MGNIFVKKFSLDSLAYLTKVNFVKTEMLKPTNPIVYVTFVGFTGNIL